MRGHDVRRILDSARPTHAERVVVFLAPGSGELAIVTTRRIGGTVQRNRARRILRAAWSELMAGSPRTHDAVLVAREAIVGATTTELVDELRRSLPRVIGPP